MWRFTLLMGITTYKISAGKNAVDFAISIGATEKMCSGVRQNEIKYNNFSLERECKRVKKMLGTQSGLQP